MNKTNEQILRKLLRELNTIETAILRERIRKICEITLAKIDTWPAGVAFFISNEYYKQIILKIQTLLEFDDKSLKNDSSESEMPG